MKLNKLFLLAYLKYYLHLKKEQAEQSLLFWTFVLIIFAQECINLTLCF